MTIDFMGGNGIGYYYRKRRDCFASLAMTTNGSGGVRLPAVIARSPPFGDAAISLFTHKIKCHEPLVPCTDSTGYDLRGAHMSVRGILCIFVLDFVLSFFTLIWSVSGSMKRP